MNLCVSVLKDMQINGPLLLPVYEDLPHLAKPFSEEEKQQALKLGEQWGVKEIEKSYPISFVGIKKVLVHTEKH